MTGITQATNDVILDVQNLSVGFGKGRNAVEVVSDVSFTLHRGEILSLVGESGCGKSLSCLALTRLLPPSGNILRGKVNFHTADGKVRDLTRIANRELRTLRGGSIGYIFQEPSASLNPVFRVEDQISEVLNLHRQDVSDHHTEVIKLLQDVGIPDPEKRCQAFPHELSGGMQQRIMIAMALAGRPELLIADEPTTALDVTIQAQILELLNNLRSKYKMSIILVTHNLGIVSEFADNVAVMYGGMIAEKAPVRELIQNPRHPYTKNLLAAVPRFGSKDSALNTIPGQVPLPGEFPAGCRFADRCQLADETCRTLCCRSEGDHIWYCGKEL